MYVQVAGLCVFRDALIEWYVANTYGWHGDLAPHQLKHQDSPSSVLSLWLLYVFATSFDL
jgi:hypothetical protein